MTVFCCGESTIERDGITRVETCPIRLENTLKKIANGNEATSDCSSRQHEFDVIHFNYEPAVLRYDDNGSTVNFLDSFTVPVALTFHNITNIPANIEYYHEHAFTSSPRDDICQRKSASANFIFSEYQSYL